MIRSCTGTEYYKYVYAYYSSIIQVHVWYVVSYKYTCDTYIRDRTERQRPQQQSTSRIPGTTRYARRHVIYTQRRDKAKRQPPPQQSMSHHVYQVLSDTHDVRRNMALVAAAAAAASYSWLHEQFSLSSWSLIPTGIPKSQHTALTEYHVQPTAVILCTCIWYV